MYICACCSNITTLNSQFKCSYNGHLNAKGRQLLVVPHSVRLHVSQVSSPPTTTLQLDKNNKSDK